MPHVSLRRLGPVDGGAVGLVRAFDIAVGAHGSTLVVIGAYDPLASVNDRPEAERARLLVGSDPFDPLLTPADPEVGVFAEVFRSQPGTLVSDHPEGRFAARGAQAVSLTHDVPWNDYFGLGSPLERLVQANGLVVRIGADPDTITLTHYAEYRADLPVKERVRRHRLVRVGNREEVRMVDSLDDSEGIADWADPATGLDDYFVAIWEAFRAAGQVHVGPIGNATGELFLAVAYSEFATQWITRNLQS